MKAKGKLGKASGGNIPKFQTGSEFDFSVSGATAVIRPRIPYRLKNRTWHIAGHVLRSPVATITEVQAGNRLVVDSVSDMFESDSVTVNTDFVKIRIS